MCHGPFGSRRHSECFFHELISQKCFEKMNMFILLLFSVFFHFYFGFVLLCFFFLLFFCLVILKIIISVITIFNMMRIVFFLLQLQ